MSNPQAKELNEIIQSACPVIYDLLSEKGRRFFFPKLGIVKQAGDAKGKKINATIGIALEDDGSPVRLKQIADKIQLNPNEVFTYAPSYGKPDLRKTWQEQILKKNPSIQNTLSLPVVTNALTHGLSVTGMMFVNPGDKIFLPDKFWGNYRLIFEEAYGGELVPFNTFSEDGFDVEALDQTLKSNRGKQIVLLNFPNNPTGYSPTIEAADAIVDTIRKSAEAGNKIAVVLDDAYFGLVYEPGVYKESLFGKLADLHENVFAIKADGATKEDYVWGLRVGFLTYSMKGITPEVCTALEEKTGGIVRGTISNDSHLSQSLILHALNSPGYAEEKKEKYALLRKRYETVKAILDQNQEKYAPYFKPLPVNSGYFMCLELQQGMQAETIRQILLTEYSTGTIAIGNLVRIAFSAVPTDQLSELLENIYQACVKASNQ
ncbi:aminotransferase class I/II-fold pyridoxal phosphate-dependent enzyme [candidate division KSB1 bacterium]|nr:aminotransferase class I/II-fold pyridoxal phosphate-dependent enzyme [candidate division KSB1 bacterium]